MLRGDHRRSLPTVAFSDRRRSPRRGACGSQALPATIASPRDRPAGGPRPANSRPRRAPRSVRGLAAGLGGRSGSETLISSAWLVSNGAGSIPSHINGRRTAGISGVQLKPAAARPGDRPERAGPAFGDRPQHPGARRSHPIAEPFEIFLRPVRKI